MPIATRPGARIGPVLRRRPQRRAQNPRQRSTRPPRSDPPQAPRLHVSDTPSRPPSSAAAPTSSSSPSCSATPAWRPPAATPAPAQKTAHKRSTSCSSTNSPVRAGQRDPDGLFGLILAAPEPDDSAGADRSEPAGLIQGRCPESGAAALRCVKRGAASLSSAAAAVVSARQMLNLRGVDAVQSARRAGGARRRPRPGRAGCSPRPRVSCSPSVVVACSD